MSQLNKFLENISWGELERPSAKKALVKFALEDIGQGTSKEIFEHIASVFKETPKLAPNFQEVKDILDEMIERSAIEAKIVYFKS